MRQVQIKLRVSPSFLQNIDLLPHATTFRTHFVSRPSDDVHHGLGRVKVDTRQTRPQTTASREMKRQWKARLAMTHLPVRYSMYSSVFPLPIPIAR